ncbi:hypothetical protein E2562_035748 [Oryza meyeriana var. granulata]|uniref:DUF4228 domain-containing protein n=1 Tax=Oryza meyeriana var. granulata TaxID=110450 RepID=A0A6G1FFJ0_9ORYZ|nr:hypothetical protein E2562_035748 [Oryza meyeriana var. granulata]
MGLKLSCIHRQDSSPLQHAHQPAPARVIAADGSLKELPPASATVAVAVADVLGGEVASFFVCSSDALYFNEEPPALAPGEVLRPGQIYFVLPAAMLGQPLSTADMAALAVRASAALAAAKAPRRGVRRGGKKKKTVRVTPLRDEPLDGGDVLFHEKLNERTLGESPASWNPPKSDEKLAAAAAAAARSPLKRALSIIQEDAE